MVGGLFVSSKLRGSISCIPLFRAPSRQLHSINNLPPCFDLSWCHKLLNDPAFKEVPIPTRTPKPSSQSSLFGRILNTQDAISYCIAVYRSPALSMREASEAVSPSTHKHVLQDTKLPSKLQETADQDATSVNELRMLMHLGLGVNGHANVAHGGFVVLILDEAMGMVNTLLKGEPVLSANLNTNFKVPLATPTVVLVRAWITKREGRKRWTNGTVEDGSGLVYADASGLFLEFKKQ